MLAIIAYLLTVIAVASFGLHSYKLFKQIASGTSDPSRFINNGKRFKISVVNVLTSNKMFNFSSTGISNCCAMFGFCVFFLTSLFDY